MELLSPEKVKYDGVTRLEQQHKRLHAIADEETRLIRRLNEARDVAIKEGVAIKNSVEKEMSVLQSRKSGLESEVSSLENRTRGSSVGIIRCGTSCWL